MGAFSPADATPHGVECDKRRLDRKQERASFFQSWPRRRMMPQVWCDCKRGEGPSLAATMNSLAWKMRMLPCCCAHAPCQCNAYFLPLPFPLLPLLSLSLPLPLLTLLPLLGLFFHCLLRSILHVPLGMANPRSQHRPRSILDGTMPYYTFDPLTAPSQLPTAPAAAHRPFADKLCRRP